MIRSETLQRTQEVLNVIARTEEFKGAWRAFGTQASDRLSALWRVTGIESIGSWTRIEGNKLPDREVERLLSSLQIKSFAARDEQEVLFVGRNRPQAVLQEITPQRTSARRNALGTLIHRLDSCQTIDTGQSLLTIPITTVLRAPSPTRFIRQYDFLPSSTSSAAADKRYSLGPTGHQ
jgi:hypothetical protein